MSRMTTVQTETKRRRQGARRGALSHGLLALACFALAGCKSPFALFSGNPADDEVTRRMANIDNERGPLERLLHGKKQADEARTLSPAEGLADFDKAKKRLDSGDVKGGEKALNKVAKNFKDSPVAEDSLFLVAESQFKRERYPAAQDSYDELLEQFPSTQYLDRVTKRLFTIAQIWLQSPTVVTSDEIQQVNFDDPSKTPAPVDPNPKPRGPTRHVPILPNAWDRSRPVFDTEGRALEALRNIWRKDPTGPLADDALMLEASYYLRKGNYSEADYLYSALRENYPKSPHFENAYVLGSHVKLMAYQGPAYDPKGLEEAEELKQSATRLFPENPAHERMQDELYKIQQQKAAQYWQDVKLYQRKGKPAAVAIYCRAILEEFPNSEYAVRARQLLDELEGKKPTESARPVTPHAHDAPAEPYEEPQVERIDPFDPKPVPEESAGRARL